jgi:hypothetical protein
LLQFYRNSNNITTLRKQYCGDQFNVSHAKMRDKMWGECCIYVTIYGDIMNPEVHSQLSVKRWGGQVEDYYLLHSFMDSTKELCSDNRHRILHTLWGVRRVVIPIFGKTLINSDGKAVNVKDLCERDHILPDYANRFIPTLNDFLTAMNIDTIPNWRDKIDRIHKHYHQDKDTAELLLSPLSQTGKLESLLLTHNSWFLTEIMPKVLNQPPLLIDYELSPADFFNTMSFQLWMDNGADLPPSARKLADHQVVLGD